jgi:AraC family transcriptional regulator, ethanolamine operon transcriptional activator
MASSRPPIHRWRSEDIDEQSTLLPGWEQEYRQLGCGRFVGSVSTVQGPRMTIVGEQTNQSLHEKIVAPADSLVFGLVLNRDDALQVNRRAVNTQSLIVLEGGKEYDFRTEGSTELLGVSLESDLFRDADSGRYRDVVERALAQSVVVLDDSATAMLRHLWLMMSTILRDNESWPDSMPLSLLADTALSNILLALNLSANRRAPAMPQSAERQARVVQQAIQYMQANLGRSFSIADVCAATHVSERTLQYHFENCLAMSPVQYLKIMRLNAARRLLRNAPGQWTQRQPTLSIAEIAAQCGYDHPSRFAGDYRRQFGVLPSETLREGAQSLATPA